MRNKAVKIIVWIVGGVVLILIGAVVAGNMIARSWSRGEIAATEESLASGKGAGAPEAIKTAGDPAKAREIKTKQIAAKMKALQPRGTYVLIDTAENRLRVMKDGKLIQEAVVSCGSGDTLQDPKGERIWIFDTPRGEFAVSAKLVNPTWIKPDWAFYEEGEQLPTDFNERVDNDTLGDYALGIGNGFFIHGTLYTRLLGRNVTHGCVRVGDKDLKVIYQIVPMGAKVYIY